MDMVDMVDMLGESRYAAPNVIFIRTSHRREISGGGAPGTAQDRQLAAAADG